MHKGLVIKIFRRLDGKRTERLRHKVKLAINLRGPLEKWETGGPWQTDGKKQVLSGGRVARRPHVLVQTEMINIIFTCGKIDMNGPLPHCWVPPLSLLLTISYTFLIR